MRKKKNSGEPLKPNMEWMNTYGDMVTLLLTFFVLLFSFSTVNELKWKKLVQAFSGSYSVFPGDGGEPVFPDNTDNHDSPTPSATLPATPGPSSSPGTTSSPSDFDHLYEGIKDYINSSGLDAKIDVTKSDIEIIIRFRDNIVFDSGRADIKDNAKPVLDNISKVLKKYSADIKMVRIEGHTDNVPIHNSRFPSNWELSTTRAVEVLKFFIGQSFENNKISAVGYGEFHPVASNATEEGRSKNRRVDFVIARLSDNETN